jgi:hypothetical protein
MAVHVYFMYNAPCIIGADETVELQAKVRKCRKRTVELENLVFHG